VLKLQSAMVPYHSMFRAAFPGTPWVFLYRQPVEVMSSLLFKVQHRVAMHAPALTCSHGCAAPHTARDGECVSNFTMPS